MEPPVNLANLRSITGGDDAIEQSLFQSFREAVDECRSMLNIALQTGDDAMWKQQAHALKGLALNLGAQHLSLLCADAQKNFTVERGRKNDMLLVIDAELERVKEAIS